MAEPSIKLPVKAGLYKIGHLLDYCAMENPKDVTSLDLSFEYGTWELLSGLAPPSDELLEFFKHKQCPIKLLPAEDWEKRQEELVAVRLPNRHKAWRWPSEPLDWNTQNFPADEIIEEMYRDRVENALSEVKRQRDANPHIPNFIQLFWSCLNAFTGVKDLELSLNVGFVYNWKIGRVGAGYRIPNFMPEMILMQEMIAAAFHGLTSLTTTDSNQMYETSIDFIGKLSELRILKIAACTGSSPEELANSIRKNINLEELHITANKPTSTVGNCSITGSVIRAANSLKTIWIEEQPYRGQISFLSIDVIDALLAHANTLTSLYIRQDLAEFITDPEILDALLRVIPQLKILQYCQIIIRVPDNLLSQRGYVANGTHSWEMEEFMPPGVTGEHPEMHYARNGNCIRDEKRQPTGSYQDKYFYFEGEGWG